MNSSIVLVTDFLIPGGVTTFIRNLSSGLRELGAQSKLPVIVLEQTAPSEALTMPGCEVHSLDHTMPHAIREDRLAVAHGILAGRRPSGVIAALGMWGFEMLRYVPGGVARIAMIQSDDSLVYRTLLPYKSCLDHLVGVSPEISRRAIDEFGFDTDIVRTIPYGVAYRDRLRPLNDEPKTLRLLYLGRIIEEQKRVSRLVALAHALDQQSVPFQLTIAGEGPARANLQSRLGSHPGVRFTGQVASDMVPELLLRHDFLVLFSDYEGIPLSIIEAAGYGVIPVVNNLPGFTEWLPDDIAVYIDTQSPDWPRTTVSALQAAATYLPNRQTKSQFWARENFSIAKMAETYAKLPPHREGVAWPKPMIAPPLAFGCRSLLYQPAARALRRVFKQLQTIF